MKNAKIRVVVKKENENHTCHYSISVFELGHYETCRNAPEVDEDGEPDHDYKVYKGNRLYLSDHIDNIVWEKDNTDPIIELAKRQIKANGMGDTEIYFIEEEFDKSKTFIKEFNFNTSRFRYIKFPEGSHCVINLFSSKSIYWVDELNLSQSEFNYDSDLWDISRMISNNEDLPIEVTCKFNYRQVEKFY